MDIKSFLSKYKFTIALVTIMIISTLLIAPYSKVEGVQQLDLNLTILLIVVGLFVGLLGGWIGTGGCSIMLPVLHFWLGFPAPLAVGTTLFAVIFTTISGGYGHFKQKNLDKRTALLLGFAGVVGVLIGSWLFTILYSNSELLGVIIGVVFIWPSVRMIWEGIKGTPEQKAQENLINGRPAYLLIFGAIIGILTGIVGLGGGYALVPGLIYLFGAPVYITMGTSLAAMVPMAVVGGSIKLIQGFVYLTAALILGIGTIIGAQIGAATIKKIKPSTLKLIFGVYFLYVALKFITNYFGIHIW